MYNNIIFEKETNGEEKTIYDNTDNTDIQEEANNKDRKTYIGTIGSMSCSYSKIRNSIKYKRNEKRTFC